MSLDSSKSGPVSWALFVTLFASTAALACSSDDDDDAPAESTALATITVLAPGTITGTAAFEEVAAGVQVTINLANCPEGLHGIHIHAGNACTDATTQGGHWDGTGTALAPSRGEGIGAGIGEISCSAAQIGGPLVYVRSNANPTTKWTIGGDAATNVLGHPIVVHGLVGANREGCGVIQ